MWAMVHEGGLVSQSNTGPKLLLNVSASFTQRHPLHHQLLWRAASVRGSRWTIKDFAKPNGRTMKDTEVKDISHLKDLDALVGHTTILDKTAPGAKSDASANVLLKRSRVTEEALAPGGA